MNLKRFALLSSFFLLFLGLHGIVRQCYQRFNSAFAEEGFPFLLARNATLEVQTHEPALPTESIPSASRVSFTTISLEQEQLGEETATPSRPVLITPRLFSVAYSDEVHIVANGTRGVEAGFVPTDRAVAPSVRVASEATEDPDTVRVATQQRLLTDWLYVMLAREERVLRKPVIVYKVHPQSGIGNMMRGLLTAMLFSVVLKKGVTVYSYDNYYCHLFFPPFPNMCNLKRYYQLKNTVCSYIPSPKNRAYFYKTPMASICPASSFVLDTYSDFSAGSLNPAFCAEPLQHAGLISASTAPRNGRAVGLEMRQVLLRLLFNPSRELCEVSNSYIRTLRQKTLIGIQLRLGGQRANYVERQMMPTDTIDTVILRVQYFLRKKGLRFGDVSIFLSSDSDYAINRLRRHFQKEQAFLVTTVAEFAVGHSAQAKSSGRGKERWAGFTKRAIVDMMVLKESDYLIYTKKSSFGKFAHELQQAYGNPMDVSAFLKQRRMNCSVFSEREHVGEASAL